MHFYGAGTYNVCYPSEGMVFTQKKKNEKDLQNMKTYFTGQ